MAMTVKEIKEYLDMLNEEDSVGVDEGGLCLLAVYDKDWYLELGGMPEDDEEEGGK